MRRLPGLLVFTACLAGVSCATTRQRAEPLPLPPVRIELSGYSFMPLAEAGWLVGGRTADEIILGKLGASSDESIIITASLMPAKGISTRESLVKFIEQQTTIAPGDKRYRNVVQDITATSVADAACALYASEMEDHGALTESGRRDPMILRQRSLVCVHPRRQDALVNVGYSQRHFAENRDPAFLEKAQSVLESIQFAER